MPCRYAGLALANTTGVRLVRMTRIAICAPSTPITHEDADARLGAGRSRVSRRSISISTAMFPAWTGHFAGCDALRLAALLECANDPGIDAVWFARGGYGACRIAEEAHAQAGRCGAWTRPSLGYSDAGYLLGALYRGRIGHPVHGPMPRGYPPRCGERRRSGARCPICRAIRSGWSLAGSRIPPSPST